MSELRNKEYAITILDNV